MTTDTMTHTEFEQRWQRAHPDYRGRVNGRRHVLKLCADGVTRSVPEPPAYVSGCECLSCREADDVHPEDLEAAADLFDRLVEAQGH